MQESLVRPHMTPKTSYFTMPPIKQQVKEINYVRILVEVASISGLVLGVCWAVAVSKGNEVWANKEDTTESLKELSNGLHVMQISTSHHITRQEASDTYVTRNEVQEFKDDFQEFAREQRAVNLEILQRLPK